MPDNKAERRTYTFTQSFVLFTTHFIELAETIVPFPGTEVYAPFETIR
jgi:hypothetical protein